jgi:hypothetical protein
LFLWPPSLGELKALLVRTKNKVPSTKFKVQSSSS